MKYRLEENSIIIIDDDGNETNITEELEECKHCTKTAGLCGGQQPACERFKCKYPEEPELKCPKCSAQMEILTGSAIQKQDDEEWIKSHEVNRCLDCGYKTIGRHQEPYGDD